MADGLFNLENLFNTGKVKEKVKKKKKEPKYKTPESIFRNTHKQLKQLEETGDY